MNISLAASAEDKTGVSITFRLPWTPVGLPALQDTGNSNTRLCLWAKHRKPPNKSKRWISGTRGNSSAEARLAIKPQKPFLPPQQAVTATGGKPIIPLAAPRTAVSEPHNRHTSNQQGRLREYTPWQLKTC